MNNTCPSCGAIYNVAAKDVGRRIKCKKCGTALVVTDTGLELDQPVPVAAQPQLVPVPVDDIDPELAEVSPRRGRAGRRASGPLGGIDPVQVFKDFGGVATLLFGFGAFLVIVFLFQPIIGAAAVQRASGAVDRLEYDWKSRQRKLEKENKSPDEISTEREKFFKDRDREGLQDDVEYARISNKRSLWIDRYGMMFGFLFLMAGSIGYMMPGQTTVRRILGTVVLGAQMLIIFMVFAAGGGCAGKPGTPFE